MWVFVLRIDSSRAILAIKKGKQYDGNNNNTGALYAIGNPYGNLPVPYSYI